MRFGRIGVRDSLFRHVIFPLAFRGAAFQWDKGMRLWDEPDGTVLASLAWERYVPTAAYVHGYGCRLSSGMTEKERKKEKYRERDRRIYCGAYRLRADLIRGLATTGGLHDVLSADVIHHVEAGEIAHTDLKIVFRENPEFDLEGTKTAILDRLWNGCQGPLSHICDYDHDISQHPKSGLLEPPLGQYRDTRPFLVRIWSIIRFHILELLLSRRP
jgi:hypothetical protein